MTMNFYIAILLLGVICLGLIAVINFWQFGEMKRFLAKLKSFFEQNQPVEQADMIREHSPVQTATSGEIDESTEAIIDISFIKNPVKGEQILQHICDDHQTLISKIGTKPIRYFVHSAATGEIHPVIEWGLFYHRLQIAVTIFNRSGVISDIEWSEICHLANRVAELSEGVTEPQPELPDFDRIKEKAAELDRQCAEIDTRVNLHILFETPLAGEKVIQVATQQGFVKYQNIMVWSDENGQVRFYLFFFVNEEDVHQVVRLQLCLDVPRVLAQQDAFANMLAIAQNLAKGFGVEVLDDHGKVVLSSTADLIDQQLAERYQLLEERGFRPASERALRIFSR